MIIDTEYTEGFSGKGRMVFKLKDAIPFTQLAMGEDIDLGVTELDELHQSVFNEIVSQVISSSSTTISGHINKKINFSFPQILIFDDPAVLSGDTSSKIELFYNLKVGSIIESIFLYQIPSAWMDEFSQPKEEAPAPEPEITAAPEPPLLEKEEIPQFIEEAPSAPPPPPAPTPPAPQVQETGAPSFSFEPEKQSSVIPDAFNQPSSAPIGKMPVVQPAQFSQLQTGVKAEEPNSLDLFLDVPMKLTAVLGRTVLYLKDVLEMGSGSVFELDRLAGEPIDLMVNNKLVARGEVVVIDEKFGVRVIETLQDQVKKKLA